MMQNREATEKAKRFAIRYQRNKSKSIAVVSNNVLSNKLNQSNRKYNIKTIERGQKNGALLCIKVDK